MNVTLAPSQRHETLSNCQTHGIRPVPCPELSRNGGHMKFDRLIADPQS